MRTHIHNAAIPDANRERSGAYITEKRSRRTHRTQIIHVAANALKEIDAEGTRNCFITRGDDIAAARTVAANAGIDDVVDRIDAALKQRGLQIGTGRQMAAQRETVASKT